MFTRSKSRLSALKPLRGTEEQSYGEAAKAESENIPQGPPEQNFKQPAAAETLTEPYTEAPPLQAADNKGNQLSEMEQVDLVRRLYKDINFSASFSGVNNLQRAIWLEKRIHITRSVITKALKTIPTYLQHMRPIRKFDRSKYNVTAFGEVCQADIAFMYPCDGFTCFLLVIDLFSHRMFTHPQKSKNKSETLTSLQNIIRQEKIDIYTLQTDQGMEFKGNKTMLRKMKIHWREKVGANKASFAEQVV
jgi:hypothetical protein